MTKTKIIELYRDSWCVDDDCSIKEMIMSKKDEIMEIVGEELACCNKCLIEVINSKIIIHTLEYVE